MADYTSKYTGTQIDTAIGIAIALKDLRGIIKITAAGPVAAVPGEDFPANSGSTVSVTGLLKGVRNAETNEIEIQQATAGTDYQIPLTAGADYATPTAVANKQNKITAQGLLKGLGDGSVAAAEAGVDYQAPIPTGTYATSSDISAAVSGHNSNASAHSEQFDKKQNVPTQLTALPDSGAALTANTIYNVSSPVGTYVFTPPASGWAHGTFSTAASVAVSFVSGANYLGAAPAIEANKTYEFDIYNGVWAVQEVVSA